jgi:hypothetical protein
MLTAVNSLIVFDRGRIVAQGPKDAVVKALAERRVSTAA